MGEIERGKKYQCGIDEAGRGPVIGPMVMSIVCGDRDKLIELRVKDSKALTPQRRKKLYEEIKESADFVRIIVISPQKINELMDSMTLNEIEFTYAAELLEEAKYATYVDCFDVIPGRTGQRLSDKTGKEVVCSHKADAIYPAVSAASIVSKVTRDDEIEKLKEIYGNFGSGYPADPATISFLEKAVSEGTDISSIVRKKWKTYENILRNKRTRRLI